MKDLYAILDEQAPDTAEALVLTLGEAAGASDYLHEAVQQRRHTLRRAMRRFTHAAKAIYGGEVKSPNDAYGECAPAKYDEDALLSRIDPKGMLKKRERDVLISVLDWAPHEQLAALSFLDLALRIPPSEREEAVEQLAEHIGPRYLAARNICIELVVNAPPDISKEQKEELREARAIITYESSRGTNDLYKAFMQPVVQGFGLHRWKGVFDERIKRHGSASTLELTLPEFKATFHHQHRRGDDLPRTFERFMDTNKFRAPPPNHRALQFLRTAQWDNVPSWPLDGYAWQLHVWHELDEWHVDHEPRYVY